VFDLCAGLFGLTQGFYHRRGKERGFDIWRS